MIQIIFILIKGTYGSQVGVLNGTVIHRLTCLPEKGRSPDLSPTPPLQPFPEALPWLGAGKMLCSLSWILVRLPQNRKLMSWTILRKVNKLDKKLPFLAQTSCSSKVPR